MAKAVISALTGNAQAGAVYELGGPEILSMREVMERVLTYTMRKRMLVSLPFPLAKLQGAMLQLLPNPPLTLDQVRLLEKDNVVSEAAKRDPRTLEGLGITSRSRSRRWCRTISSSIAPRASSRITSLEAGRFIEAPALVAGSLVGRDRSSLPAPAANTRHSHRRERAESRRAPCGKERREGS